MYDMMLPDNKIGQLILDSTLTLRSTPTLARLVAVASTRDTADIIDICIIYVYHTLHR